MCGRYNFTVEQSDEIREILEKLNAKIHGKEARTGEVFPTNLAPLLIEEEKKVEPALSTWGFPKYQQKGVIINARSETALEKRTFRGSLLNRRCIIPSTGFYEWDSSKQKFLFRQEGTNALYMAGLYSYYQEEMRFVILTTDANESIKEVHNRMPLVIPKNEIETWIMDNSAANEILHRVPPMLIKEAV
ncbi:SOS response-associated peptidase [Mobilitalea sibirica]|uniref:Abasic site processing protein n=1 Tax=Mobilitalea sibirica TaxID=1462919 RepID=A0A8J7KXR5_9FIRM|nr:SOS response-associated peptidase [Mobilitalea sibirica]MBH1942132.1 SOS response-associated peptidase [Mobilitalea sibirica]